MNTIFFGSSNYCLPILKSLLSGFRLSTVVTKPESIIYKYAKENNIQVFTPSDKNELSNLSGFFLSQNIDIGVVSDYGLIIPKSIINIPKYGIINIHFSKLPKYRGASPVQYTILNGEKEAWITYMLMDQNMDTGDIIFQEKFPLYGTETTEQLYTKLFGIAGTNLPKIINEYIEKKLIPQKQDHEKATYTKLLTREDGYIPFGILKTAIKGEEISKDQLEKWPITKSIPQLSIENAHRAFFPWPGLWTEISLRNCTDIHDREYRYNISKKRLKILKLHFEPTTNIQQLTTNLVIDLVQLEGKKPVSWKQFIEGYPVVLKN